MNHQEASEKLTLLVVGELAENVQADLTAHLAECDLCRRELADLRATYQLLAEGLTAGEPPVLEAKRRKKVLAAAKRRRKQPKPRRRRPLSWPEQLQRVAAIVLVLGTVGLILSGMFLPVLSKSREKARRVNSAGNLKQIGLGILMSSGDNDGRFPEDLSQLADENYVQAGKVFVDPRTDTPAPESAEDIARGQTDYVYVGQGLRDDVEEADEQIVAYSRPIDGSDWVNFLFADGHVEGTKTDNVERTAEEKGWGLNPPTDAFKPLGELAYRQSGKVWAGPGPSRSAAGEEKTASYHYREAEVTEGEEQAESRSRSHEAAAGIILEESNKELQSRGFAPTGGSYSTSELRTKEETSQRIRKKERGSALPAERSAAPTQTPPPPPAKGPGMVLDHAPSADNKPMAEPVPAAPVLGRLFKDGQQIQTGSDEGGAEDRDKGAGLDLSTSAGDRTVSVNLRNNVGQVDDELIVGAAVETAQEGEKRKLSRRLEEPTEPVAQADPSVARQPAPPETPPEDALPPVPAQPPPPVNPFVLTAQDRFSTFALEADTASYAIARRFIRQGYRPPPALVRMEEFINAFDYHYPRQDQQVFTVHAAGAPAPFGKDLSLLRIGVKGKVLGRDGRKPAHLIFLVDTSGSMGREDRLPLVKHALTLVLDQLAPDDWVSLVGYGRQAQLLAERVPASQRGDLRRAIESLESGTSTNLLAGVLAGYRLAARHFAPQRINRLILCSDGVANVGPSTAEDLLAQVSEFRRQGISFTSVGVGSGAYDDQMLEQLANQGDGNYIYLDSREAAQRLFGDELSATLQMIARNAKIQVEFDPRRVRRYRLIGYENRDVADRDFRNDSIDAGEIGSGQSATALYELELLPGAAEELSDLGTIYVRYENVDTGEIEEISSRLTIDLIRPRTAAEDPAFCLAAGVAEFAELLRQSEHAAGGDLRRLEAYLIPVANALPLDPRVQELLQLVQQAQGLPVAQ